MHPVYSKAYICLYLLIFSKIAIYCVFIFSFPIIKAIFLTVVIRRKNLTHVSLIDSQTGFSDFFILSNLIPHCVRNVWGIETPMGIFQENQGSKQK